MQALTQMSCFKHQPRQFLNIKPRSEVICLLHCEYIQHLAYIYTRY